MTRCWGDVCDVASLGGAKHRLDAVDALALVGAWVILAVYDADAAGSDGNEYLQSTTRRVVVVDPPADDLTAYWQEGGDLRAWIAGRVAEQMEPLLERLDEGQYQETFVRWLEIYERAAAAAASPAECAQEFPTVAAEAEELLARCDGSPSWYEEWTAVEARLAAAEAAEGGWVT